MDRVAGVPEARWLPSVDNETLKGLVMDYGALYTTIYMSPGAVQSRQLFLLL